MPPEPFVRALNGFETTLTATPADRWPSPSPCEGWSALDVAGHVIAGLMAIRARATGRPLPDAPSRPRDVAGEDPVAAWRAARTAMTAALTPEALAREVDLQLDVRVTLREWLEQYPLELLVHTWDLAQATGQTVVLNPDLVESALETAQHFAPQGRAAGMLGPERPVPANADAQTRLLALFGRAPTDQ